MSIKRMYWAPCLGLLTFMVTVPVFGQLRPPTPIDQGEQHAERSSILIRGPVHEAFAQPYMPNPVPGFAIPKAPPPEISEQPPTIGPKDQDRELTWIPGYWGWDDGRFVWVSGVWRYPPPGTRWVPGHWVRTQRDGAAWVSGFWLPDEVTRVQYLPRPPEPKTLRPQRESLHANAFWVPGCWLYANQKYVWRDGFWAQAKQDWIWTPARYIWTPRGYLFASGYWDYRIEDRGLLFAPLDASHDRHGRYRPHIVLNTDNLMVHLFTHPKYHHYYFGNYYNNRNRELFAWMTHGQPNRYYDPLYTYYQAQRSEELKRAHHQHHFFARNPSWRPPTNWAEYLQYTDRFKGKEPLSGVWMAMVAEQAVRTILKRTIQKFDAQQITPYGNSSKYYRNLTKQREKFEIYPMDKPQGKPFRIFEIPRSKYERPNPLDNGRFIRPGKGNRGRFYEQSEFDQNLPDTPRFVPGSNRSRPFRIPGKDRYDD